MSPTSERDGRDGDPPTHLRAETERWFLRRGVPHLIGNYTASERIWTRARPFLIAVLLLETLLAFGDRYTGLAQGLMFVVASALLIGAVVVLNRVRRRRLFDVPRDVGIPELVFFVLTPAAIALVVSQEPVWTAAGTMMANAVILAVTYVVVGFGLFPMIRWALTKLGEHVLVLVRLMARTLPVLLVLTVFMFINAEIWQVAYFVDPPGFLVVSLGIIAIGIAFLWINTAQILERVDPVRSWAQAGDLAAESPLAGVDEPPGSPTGPTLDRSAQLNLRILITTGVATQVVLVGLLVAFFYVLIGLVLITPEVLAQWIGVDDLHEVGRTSIGRLDLTLTREHLRVSGLIGALAGLNTAVAALTDEAFRRTFTEDLVTDVEENLAVCAIYETLPPDS